MHLDAPSATEFLIMLLLCNRLMGMYLLECALSTLDVERLLQPKVMKENGQVLEYSFQVSHLLRFHKAYHKRRHVMRHPAF